MALPLQKNPGPLLTSKRYGAVQNFPQEFIASVGIVTLSQQNPVDIEPFQIGTVELLVESSVEQSRTDERKKVDIYLTEVPSGVLESQVKLDSGLVGDRTRKLVPDGTPLAPIDGLTEVGNQENLGNGWLDQTIVEAPELFEKFQKTKSHPVVTPEDFRALLQEGTIAQTKFSPMPDPVLAAGEIERSHEELDVFKYRESVHSIDTLGLPATNVNKRTNQFKQVETVTRILELASTTPAVPTILQNVSFTKLGDGTALEERAAVPSLFAQQRYVVEVDLLGNLPPEFRSGIERVSTSSEVAGTATLPVLTAGVEYKSEEQVTVFSKKIEQRELDFDTLGSLVDYRMTPEQQLETITKDITSTPPSPFGLTALTVDHEIKTLGGGLWLKVEGTVPEVFDKQEYSRRRELFSALPSEFRSLLTESSQSSEIVGAIAHDLALTAGQTYRSEQRVTEFKKKVETRGVDLADLPVSLTGKELTEEYGGGILNVTFDLDNSALTIDEGLTVVSSSTKNLGGGLFSRETKELSVAAWPILESRLWDENWRTEYDETRQVVAAGTSEAPDPGVFGWVSEVKAIDKWRSVRINTSKPTPAYTDEGSALVSYEYKPFRFPGYLYIATAQNPYYVRHADATLCQHKIKTWWLKSTSTPTVGVTGSGADVEVDEIIQDDVVIGSLNNINSLTYSGPILHDALTLGAVFYAATTPSYTQYVLGTPTGGTTLVNIISLYTPGSSGGYVVGDTITCAGGGHSATTTVLSVYDVDSITGLIGAMSLPAISGNFPAGNYGPFVGGGSGSGALFNVTGFDQPNYTPGTQWIGTYRVVGAAVTPEKEKNVWKVITESVVMR